MVGWQQAQERLEAFRQERADRTITRRLALLPPRLARIGRALWSDGGFWGLWGNTERAQLEAFQRGLEGLDVLSPKQRRRLFAAFFPTFPEVVEDAWQARQRAPYQTGPIRKAFRAPRSAAASRLARGQWLTSLIAFCHEYHQQDLTWFAAWAPLLGFGADQALAPLFAAAIDGGEALGLEIYDILTASARGEHEVGSMGRHVTRALLSCESPEAWAFVERLLLAAQRQEGLRQVILEAVDEAHPGAYVRLLETVRREGLARFASVVRAADVWFGFQLDSSQRQRLEAVLEHVQVFLEVPEERARGLAADDPETVYLALWAQAFEDADAAVGQARQLLTDDRPEMRFVAAHLLAQLELPAALEALLPAFEDSDLRVAVRAFEGLSPIHLEAPDGLFDAAEALLARLPKKTTLAPLVWPWTERPLERAQVASVLVSKLGERPPTRLLKHLPLMNADGRLGVVAALEEWLEQDKRHRLEPDIREALLGFCGDRSAYVRERAVELLRRVPLEAGEAEHLEALLTRKAGDLRRGVLTLLLKQNDTQTLASARRLLADSDDLKRQAGEEILAELKRSGRARRGAEALASETPATAEQPTEPSGDGAPATLETGLGLYRPDDLTTPSQPRKLTGGPLTGASRTFASDAAQALLTDLDAHLHEHRDAPVQVSDGLGRREELFGNLEWRLPLPQGPESFARAPQEVPLWEVWAAWWTGRGPELRDDDGLELLRALASLTAWTGNIGALSRALRRLLGPEPNTRLYANVEPLKLRYPQLIDRLLPWFLTEVPADLAVELILDGVEAGLALIPRRRISKASTDQEPSLRATMTLLTRPDLREHPALIAWLLLGRQFRSLVPDAFEARHWQRLWGLLRWRDQGHRGATRVRPLLDEVVAALEAGAATEADLFDQLIGPRDAMPYSWPRGFHDLRQLSGRRPQPLLAQQPRLADVLARTRARILELELARGELPTPVSEAAMALRAVYGADTALTLLRALGKQTFARGFGYGNLGKKLVLSHLLRVSFPADDDTAEAFKAGAKARKLSTRRLLDLAVFAPQWAGFVEQTLAWPGLEEAVWWLHAHTKDQRWAVDKEVREVWEAEVSERTPLSGQELLDGAVDVAWFNRLYRRFGSERWRTLDGSAKYASGGAGHARARLFAQALTGALEAQEVLERIGDKRHQDSVRALGLVPLPKAAAAARKALQERYQALLAFREESKQFGAQRQASERRAADMALHNLARNAGYPDPQRLVWALEREQVADLAAGPVEVQLDEVVLSLSLDQDGSPQLGVRRGERKLKAVPAKLRKHPEVVALRARKTTLGKQRRRVRDSLEAAMNRGDTFAAGELNELLTHPLLAPLLHTLVLVTEDGALGYPGADGTLEGPNGHVTLGDTHLRIAHPVDLLGHDWHGWQQACMARGRAQPFKQVFRELYLLTDMERQAGKLSQRYQGHQLNPSQALALWGRRGWLRLPEDGAMRRTFHHEGLSAWALFTEPFYTPAEIDGLTLDEIYFSEAGAWQPIDLEAVPARVFSEAMRDLDLVVSVAHRGGVDPEASASTVEMRSALLRETLALLKLDNARLEGSHALIEGTLSSYSVHLGSAVVHRQPGGALCIVPVPSQQRGRLFLPFADDDPKTAEVVAKVLMLAQDENIRDPSILEQLR